MLRNLFNNKIYSLQTISTNLSRITASKRPQQDFTRYIKLCNISTKGIALIPKDESLVARIFKKIPFVNLTKSRLNVIGLLMYENIADNVRYFDFFKQLELPDTFYSWFVVTELHIWMLSVRCMAEGEDGILVRNQMVAALWTDVNRRTKQLGDVNPSGMRTQIRELSEQFHAALISYDEGIQSDDIVLAGALWRRIYQSEYNDVEHLDTLVKYVRKQIKLLDGINREELFSNKCMNWEPLKVH